MTAFPYRTPATRPPEAIVPLPDEATRLGPLRKTYAPASVPKLLRFPALMALVMMVVSARNEAWFDLEFLMYCQVRTTGLRLMELSGGTFYVAGPVDDAVGLFNAVLRRCSEPLVAEARAALREGEVLTFGKVRISRDGMRIGDAKAAWSEIHLVRLQPGKALFLRGSSLFAWRTVKHDEIPHPTVFLRLVSELAPKVENDESLASATSCSCSSLSTPSSRRS